MLPRIRAGGYRAALVAQNGIEDTDIEWSTFDALFIGGSTDWKLSQVVIDLIGEAKARGLWVHVGRVNSRRRYHWSMSHGADSSDGTYAAFGPDVNIAKMSRWGFDVRQLPIRFE